MWRLDSLDVRTRRLRPSCLQSRTLRLRQNVTQRCMTELEQEPRSSLLGQSPLTQCSLIFAKPRLSLPLLPKVSEGEAIAASHSPPPLDKGHLTRLDKGHFLFHWGLSGLERPLDSCSTDFGQPQFGSHLYSGDSLGTSQCDGKLEA